MNHGVVFAAATASTTGDGNTTSDCAIAAEYPAPATTTFEPNTDTVSTADDASPRAVTPTSPPGFVHLSGVTVVWNTPAASVDPDTAPKTAPDVAVKVTGAPDTPEESDALWTFARTVAAEPAAIAAWTTSTDNTVSPITIIAVLDVVELVPSRCTT
jgi:hypothetical protein